MDRLLIIENEIKNLSIIDIKNVDNDTLIDLIEKLGSICVNMTVEATQRINDMIFTDEQSIRMTNVIINQSCNIFDELGITEDQAIKGNASMQKIIFDPNR